MDHMTIGELVKLLQVAIMEYGEDTPCVVVGCYQSVGDIEAISWRGKDKGWNIDGIYLESDICSG